VHAVSKEFMLYNHEEFSDLLRTLNAHVYEGEIWDSVGGENK
jgi:hypothetical protein